MRNTVECFLEVYKSNTDKKNCYQQPVSKLQSSELTTTQSKVPTVSPLIICDELIFCKKRFFKFFIFIFNNCYLLYVTQYLLAKIMIYYQRCKDLTWNTQHSTITDIELFPSNYTVFRRDRPLNGVKVAVC